MSLLPFRPSLALYPNTTSNQGLSLETFLLISMCLNEYFGVSFACFI